MSAGPSSIGTASNVQAHSLQQASLDRGLSVDQLNLAKLFESQVSAMKMAQLQEGMESEKLKGDKLKKDKAQRIAKNIDLPLISERKNETDTPILSDFLTAMQNLSNKETDFNYTKDGIDFSRNMTRGEFGGDHLEDLRKSMQEAVRVERDMLAFNVEATFISTVSEGAIKKFNDLLKGQ